MLLVVLLGASAARAADCDVSKYSGSSFGISDAQLASAIQGARSLGFTDCSIEPFLAGGSDTLTALPVSVTEDPDSSGPPTLDLSTPSPRSLQLPQYTNTTEDHPLKKVYNNVLGGAVWRVQRDVAWTFDGQNVLRWNSRTQYVPSHGAVGWSYEGVVDKDDRYYSRLGADGKSHAHAGLSTWVRYRMHWSMGWASTDNSFVLARDFYSNGGWGNPSTVIRAALPDSEPAQPDAGSDPDPVPPSTAPGSAINTPNLISVTSGNIGYVQAQPWSASGWGPLINWPSDMTMATTGAGTTWMVAKDDPDLDGRGTEYFQTSPFSLTWNPIAPLIGPTMITTPVGGGAMVTGVDEQTGILYFQDSPFTASGWHAISPATDRVAATAPKEGGTQIVERDVRAPHIAYVQNSPYRADGWLPIANSVDEIAVTSPASGGTMVGITDENTHKAWFQNSPYTAEGWHVLADDVRHIVMTRAGDGSGRVGIVTMDGAAYVQTYPFSAGGWQQVAPASWNVSKLAMSGDMIGVIRDAGGGNHVASFQREPFSIDGWHDVANSATDLGFDQKGF
jgi:hypothetical protein